MRTKHGRATDYNQGCRCDLCREANTQRHREYRARTYVPKPRTKMDPGEKRRRFQEYQKRRHAERRAMAIELLGGECANCGSNETLEFDHIDPATKVYTVATMFASRRWELIERELQKCQLLCRPCHLSKTHGNRV